MLMLLLDGRNACRPSFECVGWEDLLEGIIDLRDVAAEHAEFLESLGWIRTSFEIWCKLLFEGPPVNVNWRVDRVDLEVLIG